MRSDEWRCGEGTVALASGGRASSSSTVLLSSGSRRQGCRTAPQAQVLCWKQLVGGRREIEPRPCSNQRRLLEHVRRADLPPKLHCHQCVPASRGCRARRTLRPAASANCKHTATLRALCTHDLKSKLASRACGCAPPRKCCLCHLSFPTMYDSSHRRRCHPPANPNNPRRTTPYGTTRRRTYVPTLRRLPIPPLQTSRLMS